MNNTDTHTRILNFKTYIRNKNSKTLCHTLYTIESLPFSVSQKIYEEVIISKKLCKTFLNMILVEYDISAKPSNLWDNMLRTLKDILKHTCIIEYLKKHFEPFNIQYNNHYILNKCQYNDIDIDSSLLLAIINMIYY